MAHGVFRTSTQRGEFDVIHKALVPALFLLVMPLAALGQEFEKNGMPCVAEICIGDGIAELSKMRFDRAAYPLFNKTDKTVYIASRKVSAKEMRDLGTSFTGDLTQAAPYLHAHVFESEALPALSRITAACDRNELTGTYTTASGNPTRVAISMTPSPTDTSSQRWTVVSISRTFPAAISNEQKAQVEAQLRERYFKYGADNMNLKNPKTGEAWFSHLFGNFGFNLMLFKDDDNRLKLHPNCGGATKVKID